MGFTSLLRSPKKEEQQVPETINSRTGKDVDIMDEFEGIIGLEENFAEGNNIMYSQLNWDFMEWEGFSVNEEEEHEGNHLKVEKIYEDTSMCFQEESHFNIKRENLGFLEYDDNDDDEEEEEEKRMCLNLSLNYQEVLDAWSGRGSLWAGEFSLSSRNNGYVSTTLLLILSFFLLSVLAILLILVTSISLNLLEVKFLPSCVIIPMGEVPVMEEEKTRREASVLRYKEKRQSRLFSKKIRYQVRKLNADKRPRLKGRFVKRVPAEKIH
ncbi:hypothetical protein RJ640_025156 [Escallonia rubra]|uniref:CCT domain-containing protein n=1 Tax=Escallonia rubra TaxID=112253 RepID=A0AA88UFK9_9ASTE|nr:hypothetical protein RJ640_025156 [Escallonia rubra]